MSKVCVVGGCGFLGSHVVDKLTELGHEVAIIDSMANGYDWWGGKHPYVTIPIQSFAADAYSPATWIINTACSSLPVSLGEPWEVWHENVEIEEACIKLAKRWGAKYLSISSMEALHPEASFYGASKAACEMLCRAADVPFLRFPNLYGPRHRPGKYGAFLPRLINRWLEGKPMKINRSAAVKRRYAYVKDIADSISSFVDWEGEMWRWHRSHLISLDGWIEGLKAEGIDGRVKITDDRPLDYSLGGQAELPPKKELRETIKWVKTWKRKEK